MAVDEPVNENIDAAPELVIAGVDSELGQGGNSCSANSGVLEDDAVVDETNELGRLWGFRTLHAEEMENADREFGELAILDKFAQVGQRDFLAFRDEFDHIEDCLHDCALEVIATFVPENSREEVQHEGLLCWEFEREGSDRVYNDDFELVGNL